MKIEESLIKEVRICVESTLESYFSLGEKDDAILPSRDIANPILHIPKEVGDNRSEAYRELLCTSVDSCEGEDSYMLSADRALDLPSCKALYRFKLPNLCGGVDVWFLLNERNVKSGTMIISPFDGEEEGVVDLGEDND